MDSVPYIELECEATEVCCWQQNFCPELYLGLKMYKNSTRCRIEVVDASAVSTRDVFINCDVYYGFNTE